MKTITLSIVEFILLMVLLILGTSYLWYAYYRSALKLLEMQYLN